MTYTLATPLAGRGLLQRLDTSHAPRGWRAGACRQRV